MSKDLDVLIQAEQYEIIRKLVQGSIQIEKQQSSVSTLKGLTKNIVKGMNLSQGSKSFKERKDLPKSKKNVRRITLSLADVID